MSRDRVNTFSTESFVNVIGQTLNPGDEVVAVTTGYGHTVRILTGIFEGVYRSPKDKVVGTRIGNVPVKFNDKVYAEDGTHVETRYNYSTWKSEPTGKRYNLVPNVRYRKSSLQLNRVFLLSTPAAHLPDRLS